MRRDSFLTGAAVILALLTSIAPAVAGERRKLAEPADIDGVPCEKVAWLTRDGRLEACFLSRDTTLGGQKLPRGTRIGLDAEGNLDCVFLPRTTEIEGHRCRGHGHAYQTCFRPNGRLRFCNLEQRETVQGVPCEKSTFLTWIFRGNAGLEFHESGKLKGCLLAEDVEIDGRRYRSGQRFEQGP